MDDAPLPLSLTVPQVLLHTSLTTINAFADFSNLSATFKSKDAVLSQDMLLIWCKMVATKHQDGQHKDRQQAKQAEQDLLQSCQQWSWPAGWRWLEPG